jgi:hypothetical protein
MLHVNPVVFCLVAFSSRSHVQGATNLYFRDEAAVRADQSRPLRTRNVFLVVVVATHHHTSCNNITPTGISALTSELSTCTPRLTRNLKHMSGLNLRLFGPSQAFGLKGTYSGPFAVTLKRGGYARLSSSAGSCRWACTTAITCVPSRGVTGSP